MLAETTGTARLPAYSVVIAVTTVEMVVLLAWAALFASYLSAKLEKIFFNDLTRAILNAVILTSSTDM